VTPSDAIVYKGGSISVNVTVENHGDYTETFNLTLYADPHISIKEPDLVGYWTFNELVGQTAYALTLWRVEIGTETVTLNIDGSKTVSFMWNTTDIPLGNYTLTAYAEPVLGETHTTDNIETNGVITVVPESPSILILPLFMMATLLSVIAYRRKHTM